MSFRRLSLAVVSALMATQHNTGEAAVTGPNTGHEQNIHIQASAAQEEAIVALFNELSYTQVLEKADETWPRLEAMPDRVLYCVAESYIRSGKVQSAKAGFELLVTRGPQNHSYRAGLAYTLLYAGEMNKGLGMYRQVLLENPKMLTVAAEDAVALLSQGNISGGKALFQMAIDISPVKDEYRQWYERTLRMYGLADDIPARRSIEVNVGAQPPAPAENDSKLLKAQAMEMAKAGQYDKALAVLQPAINDGEREALLLAGEMYMLRGDITAANIQYERLLAKNPNDYDVYFNRGLLSLKKKDYQQAARDLERARILVPDGPDKAIRLGLVEHDLAVAYIQLGKDEKAASILAKHTKTLPVDSLIAGDYISALGNSVQHELAVQEAERLWPSYTQAPIAGLRALAESYIQLGKQEQAIAVYRHIVERQSGDDASGRILAFQLMLNGSTNEGLSYYERSLDKVANKDSVVSDAVTLLNTENYFAGKLLFELVLSKYPDQACRKQYAEALSKNKLNRAAYYQYEIISAQQEDELAGLSGMVRTALALGDYPKFRQAFDTITDKYGRSKAVAAIESSYEERQPGSVETTYAVVNGYPRPEFTSLNAVQPQTNADASKDLQNTDKLAVKPAGITEAKVITDADKLNNGKTMATDANNGPTEPKVTVKLNNAETNQKVTVDPGYIEQETYKSLINEVMQVGDSSKHIDHKINVDGEIRYHYAVNSSTDQAGLRTYIGAGTRINKDWNAYAVLEGHKNIKNYKDEFKLSRLYAAGKLGETAVKAGKFGYLMADGNIYDSGFTGVRLDFGKRVKYTLSYGETNDTKTTYTAAVRYDDFDYTLESGIYKYKENDGENNTIWNVSGTYKFNDFSIGAMYLWSSLKDSQGDSDGYVLSFNYGDLRSYRPGTYEIFAKYYDQAQGTYIAHGMNGKGSSMEGFKGYGVGMQYTLATDFVGGIEYYNLIDKVSDKKEKTLWLQMTHYF